MKMTKLLTGISGLAIALVSLLPVEQAKASEGEFKDPWTSISSSEVTDNGGIRLADGGRIDWCMPDELVRQVQFFSILDGKPTRFRGESPIVGERPGCSRLARFMIADAFCKMRGFDEAESFHVTPLNYIYSTNSGRQVRDGSGRVMYTPRIAEGRNGPIATPGWTQIDNRSNGKFDYIRCTKGNGRELTKGTGSQEKPQTSTGGASGHNEVVPPPPRQTCSPNFSPATFQGRTGRVAFYNEWNMPVTVIIYHPNSRSIYNRYTVPPEQNQFLGNNIIVGDDWGVCFENKPSASGFVNNLGTISNYNPNYQGIPLFMIHNGRIK